MADYTWPLGTLGDNITGSITYSTGVLVISGTGPTYDFDYSTPSGLQGYFPRKIIIESGVTELGNNLFIGCNYVTSVTIPDTVTRIGVNCFASCLDLPSIEIPASVNTIGDAAFANCGSLNEIVNLYDGNQTVGLYILLEVTSLVKAYPANTNFIRAAQEVGCSIEYLGDVSYSYVIIDTVEQGYKMVEGQSMSSVDIVIPTEGKKYIQAVSEIANVIDSEGLSLKFMQNGSEGDNIIFLETLGNKQVKTNSEICVNIILKNKGMKQKIIAVESKIAIVGEGLGIALRFADICIDAEGRGVKYVDGGSSIPVIVVGENIGLKQMQGQSQNNVIVTTNAIGEKIGKIATEIVLDIIAEGQYVCIMMTDIIAFVSLGDMNHFKTMICNPESFRAERSETYFVSKEMV